MKSRIPRTATEKVTLKEIARAAKVSIATASRVLNGSGGGSPDVVRRVRATAARLQAKLERPAASRTICFLLANRSMLHSFHAQVLMGCQEFAKEQQNHVLFYPFHYPATADPADIDLPLLDGRSAVDGYVVSGMNTENLLQLLIQDGVPFSVLGNNVLGPWEPDAHDVVWMDDLTGAYELTGYLLRKGHEKIGFLGSSRFPSSRIQLGYSRAMQEAGLSPLSVENDVAEEAECGYLAAK